MAKFECVGTPDLVVGTSGKIKFKNYSYTTTDKDEIALIRKAKDVKEIGVKPTPKPKPKDTLDV